EEIRSGRFREDLFFRLNVIPIFVPPLRTRGDDVLRLAEHFVAEFAAEYGRRSKRLSPEAVGVVKAYRWPGNVRELRNVIERLMIMVPSDVISAADLTFLEIPERVAGTRDPSSVAPLYEARDAWEREYILGALSAFDGNISRASDALGVERSNLYRKMRGLGIPSGRKDEDEEIADR